MAKNGLLYNDGIERDDDGKAIVRDDQGRFVKGVGGGGKGLSAKQRQLRVASLAKVKDEDVQTVLSRLFTIATEQEFDSNGRPMYGANDAIAAAKEWLQRVLGPAQAYDIIEQAESMDELLRSLQEQFAGRN